jgi:hypothetical protein
MWTGELDYEIRPCRWVDGRLAVWCPHKPGQGKPIFAKPHPVRQRRSVAALICTVCGQPTPPSNRWWFKLGQFHEGWFMTTEAPLHRACADHAKVLCPRLRSLHADGPWRFPNEHSVLSAIIGDFDDPKDQFNVKLQGRTVVGQLKIAWPRARVVLEAAQFENRAARLAAS